MNDLSRRMEIDGFAVVSDLLPPQSVEHLKLLTDKARNETSSAHVSNSRDTYGLRNLTDVVPEAIPLLLTPKLYRVVEQITGTPAFMVRATLFDKTPEANWGVFWHQDLAIAVKEKHEVRGFSGWTQKAGVCCVQPPPEIMQQVLAVRIHLDPCDGSNGALRVLPGTHGNGRQGHSEPVRDEAAVLISARPGDALLMRPLLLHASSPMNEPRSRRVIHLEFAAFRLPAPLEWHQALREVPPRQTNTPADRRTVTPSGDSEIDRK